MNKINEMLKGKKTITSAIVIATIAILQYLKLIDDSTAKIIIEIATATGLYGLYSKETK